MKANVSRSIRIAGLVAMLALSVLLLGSIASEAQSAAFTVNSTDDVDDGTCDPAHCSLREAILAANAGPGTDTIEFDIPGSGPHTIQLAAALPTITDAVVIDGYTQPGARPNTNGSGLGINAVLKIELDGSNAGDGAHGLRITAGNSTVRGLVINSLWGTAIELLGGGGNVIEGNFFGTDVAGTFSVANFGSSVRIVDSPNNTVGGTTAGARNVISGSIFAPGVEISGSGATGNVVQGNFIGPDATGAHIVWNNSGGVLISNAPNNTIGGTVERAGNLISGNGLFAVEISGSGATGNVVQGNLIGTDISGIRSLLNMDDGVRIIDAPNNTIGGTTAAARNVISASQGRGIVIEGAGAAENVVQGNFIGTDASGTTILIVRQRTGIFILNAPRNRIGGTATGAGNVISGHWGPGVLLLGSSAAGNVVEGNLIGTNVTGTATIGNWLGVHILGPNNTVGGTAPGAGNVISGNDTAGVSIVSGSATGNLVQGNLIGTDVTGTAALGNEWGVLLRARNNTIGGTAAGAGNVISGNRGLGLNIHQSAARENLVQGNFIGTDVTGTTALGNGGDGVVISGGASANTIGGTTPQARNVVSGNDGVGILISGPPTAGNQVQGNYIGTQVDGTSPLGNGSHGVLNIGPTRDNVVGGRAGGAGNTIAFNGGDGVSIHYGFSTGNAILSNSIFSNAGLGIDLGGDGVSPNDAGDGDTGANNLQNFPLLAAAGSGSTAIQGTLNSAPDTEFGLEFFSVSTCDPSGYGEGETLLGSAAVTTDSSGNASFAVGFAPVGPPRRFVTATATDPDGNTSEFSPCTAIPVAECVFTDGFGRGTELLVTGDAWTFTGPGAFEASGTGARQKRDRVIVSGRSGNVVVSGEGLCPSGAGHFRAVELDPPRRKLRLVDLG